MVLIVALMLYTVIMAIKLLLIGPLLASEVLSLNLLFCVIPIVLVVIVVSVVMLPFCCVKFASSWSRLLLLLLSLLLLVLLLLLLLLLLSLSMLSLLLCKVC